MLFLMEICASSARVSKTLADSLMYVTIWVRTETSGSGAAEVTRDKMEDRFKDMKWRYISIENDKLPAKFPGFKTRWRKIQIDFYQSAWKTGFWRPLSSPCATQHCLQQERATMDSAMDGYDDWTKANSTLFALCFIKIKIKKDEHSWRKWHRLQHVHVLQHTQFVRQSSSLILTIRIPKNHHSFVKWFVCVDDKMVNFRNWTDTCQTILTEVLKDENIFSKGEE